jgi:hypothetical protein
MFSALTGTEVEAEIDDGDEDKRREQEELVREVYEYWRGTGEVEEATLGWAKWLLVRKKRGDEATKVISRACGGGGALALAHKWAAIVRGL